MLTPDKRGCEVGAILSSTVLACFPFWICLDGLLLVLPDWGPIAWAIGGAAAGLASPPSGGASPASSHRAAKRCLGSRWLLATTAPAPDITRHLQLRLRRRGTLGAAPLRVQAANRGWGEARARRGVGDTAGRIVNTDERCVMIGA